MLGGEGVEGGEGWAHPEMACGFPVELVGILQKKKQIKYVVPSHPTLPPPPPPPLKITPGSALDVCVVVCNL